MASPRTRRRAWGFFSLAPCICLRQASARSCFIEGPRDSHRSHLRKHTRAPAISKPDESRRGRRKGQRSEVYWRLSLPMPAQSRLCEAIITRSCTVPALRFLLFMREVSSETGVNPEKEGDAAFCGNLPCLFCSGRLATIIYQAQVNSGPILALNCSLFERCRADSSIRSTGLTSKCVFPEKGLYLRM
jgi:hypothetical protein